MAIVLVADDEPDVCYLVSIYLRRAGHEVFGASDGGEVLGAVREHKPDLLVLDLSLPGLNGLELCRQLRADPETVDMPILMLSGWAFDSDVQAGLQAGADDYVTKPFHGPALVARAESLLTRRRRPAGGTPTEHDGTLSVGSADGTLSVGSADGT